MNYLEKYHRVFAEYKTLRDRAEFLIRSREKGNFGIACNDDDIAIEYQQRCAWRLEVMDAFLSGREPNHACKRWWKNTEVYPHIYYSEYRRILEATKEKA